MTGLAPTGSLSPSAGDYVKAICLVEAAPVSVSSRIACVGVGTPPGEKVGRLRALSRALFTRRGRSGAAGTLPPSDRDLLEHLGYSCSVFVRQVSRRCMLPKACVTEKAPTSKQLG